MDKIISKKVLISTIVMFLITFIISCTLVFALVKTGHSSLDLTNLQALLLAVGCAVVPTGSFVGFFTSLSKIKEISKPAVIALCVLFPVTIVAMTIYGILAIIPTAIKCIIVLAKK